MKTKRFTLSIATLMAMTGMSMAADLGGPSYGGSIKDEPIPVRAFSWTGFYAGLHAGYAFNVQADYDYLIAGNFEPVGRVRPTSPDGFIGGGQIGYNYQAGPLVYGVEGTLSGGALSDTLKENPPPVGNDYRTSSEINLMGTVVGRIGFAADRTLFYVRGGYAYASLDFEAKFFNKDGPGGTNGSLVRISNDFDHHGWVVGGGIEYAVTPNVIVGLEYNHMDFGSQVATLPTTNSGILTEKVRSTLEMDSVTARLSYKLN